MNNRNIYIEVLDTSMDTRHAARSANHNGVYQYCIDHNCVHQYYIDRKCVHPYCSHGVNQYGLKVYINTVCNCVRLTVCINTLYTCVINPKP